MFKHSLHLAQHYLPRGRFLWGFLHRFDIKIVPRRHFSLIGWAFSFNDYANRIRRQFAVMDDQIDFVAGINQVSWKSERVFQKVGNVVLVMLFTFGWASFYLLYKFKQLGFELLELLPPWFDFQQCWRK